MSHGYIKLHKFDLSTCIVAHSAALEERMARLEGKVDDLRELMMRILRQMESEVSFGLSRR